MHDGVEVFEAKIGEQRDDLTHLAVQSPSGRGSLNPKLLILRRVRMSSGVAL